jgi:hypothetical protein
VLKIVFQESCELSDLPFSKDAPVLVSGASNNSFTFTALHRHFYPEGSTITFWITEDTDSKNIWLHQTGVWNETGFLNIEGSRLTEPFAWSTWYQQAHNLSNGINPGAGADQFSGF